MQFSDQKIAIYLSNGLDRSIKIAAENPRLSLKDFHFSNMKHNVE